MQKIDIALICGRRPELLYDTLHSFEEKLFRHFDVDNCYANIDPFCGDDEDGRLCRDMILDYFPNARITMPEKPSFGQAVKTVWGQVQSPLVFHLEDDWLALEDVTPERVLPYFKGVTRAAKLVCKEDKWNGVDEFHTGKRKFGIAGMTLWRQRYNMFGTGPSFFASEFIRQCSALMNPDLDPERQMRPPHNMPLHLYVRQFQCRVMPGINQPELIVDTGREWRRQRDIEKTVADGKSVWTGGRGPTL